MAITYPTYPENYPESVRKIKKQYLSYRGKINTSKINSDYQKHQYESPLERDFISILIQDLYCYEVIPQAKYKIPDESGEYHEYAIDVWALYLVNREWIIYLYEVKPKNILEKLNCEDFDWKKRIKLIKSYVNWKNNELRSLGLNVKWNFKLITEEYVYNQRFHNIIQFLSDSKQTYENELIRSVMNILDSLYSKENYLVYYDLETKLTSKLNETENYPKDLASSILNYLIYYQFLYFDWNSHFDKATTLLYFNKEQKIKPLPSYETFPIKIVNNEFNPEIISITVDWDFLDNQFQEIAKNRLRIIKPLIEKQQKDLLTKNQVEEIAKQENLHFTSIYNWIKKYKESNYDLRSLIPQTKKRGRRTSRLSDKVINIINKHILYECDCCKVLSTQIFQYENIKNECEDEGLKSPNINTVRKFIRQIPARERKGKQGGVIKYEIQKSIKNSFDRGDYPLHFVQVDSTWLDILVINELTGEVQRPFITTYVDVKTRMLFSYWMTLREHTAVDVNRGMMRGILPKENLLKKYDISASYPIHGIPYRLQFDNGKIFDTKFVEDFCFKYGVVDYQFRMVKRPDTGTFVERLNRTINESWLSVLDGYAPPIKDRPQEYNPEKHKNLMAFNDFQKWFLLRVIQYHNDEHGGLYNDLGEKITPISYYFRCMKGRIPKLPFNYSQMHLDVLHFKETLLTPYGITFYKNHYNNDGKTKYLLKIRAMNRGKVKSVFWRYDPEDIREIYVYYKWAEKSFYFSVKFSTGLLSHFIRRNPNIPIPLRDYNNVRKNLRNQNRGKENDPEEISCNLEYQLLKNQISEIQNKDRKKQLKGITIDSINQEVSTSQPIKKQIETKISTFKNKKSSINSSSHIEHNSEKVFIVKKPEKVKRIKIPSKENSQFSGLTLQEAKNRASKKKRK